MGGYYIGAHVRTRDAEAVRREVVGLFETRGFRLVGDEAAGVAVEDEDALPEGEDWYGVIVSGAAGRGWVSVYVDDWQDSGVLARGLSQALAAPVLEVWVAEDVHWGYTYFEGGVVADRFADDPGQVAETPGEAAQYVGNAAALGAVSQVPADRLQAQLREAQARAGQFAGGPVDALAGALGLPFEHVFTGYEDFFADDPEDYGPALENWRGFRHLAFERPPGREGLE